MAALQKKRESSDDVVNCFNGLGRCPAILADRRRIISKMPQSTRRERRVWRIGVTTAESQLVTVWTVYKLAAKQTRVGEVEAATESEPSEKAAAEFKQHSAKLMAVRSIWRHQAPAVQGSLCATVIFDPPTVSPR